MGKKRKKRRYQKKIRIILLVILSLLIIILWSRFIIGIALTALFAIATFLSIQFSVKLEYIDLNCYLATSCFMGYVFGPMAGLLYALFVGGISYSIARMSFNSVSTITIATVFATVCGILGSYFSLDLNSAYIIIVITQGIVSSIWFYVTTSNLIRVLGIHISQLVINLFLYLPLLNLFYVLLIPFI